jgi:hypothetical protein
MTVRLVDQLSLPGPARSEAEVPRLGDLRPWILTESQLGTYESPPGAGLYPGLASRPWVLVTDQDPDEGPLGEAYEPPGDEADTRVPWTDGKTIWKVTFLAGPAVPGLAGIVMGNVPGIGTVVRMTGCAVVSGLGTVEINGSGFGATVQANGDVRVFGPDGVALSSLHMTVWFTKV